MDSFKDVLEAAQAYCKTQMAEPTYNLYIDGLEPISFEDSSHITLSVRNDFICKIVTDRYLGLLKEAFTIQGSAADIIKVAMIRIYQRFQEEGIRSKMILQVHDELNFSVLPEEKEKVQQIVISEMEAAYKMKAPLRADHGWGHNWLEAH